MEREVLNSYEPIKIKIICKMSENDHCFQKHDDSICMLEKIFANMKIRLDHSPHYSYSYFFLKTFYDNFENSDTVSFKKKF